MLQMIVHNDKCGISNWGNITFLDTTGQYIQAHYTDGSKRFIARYASPDRADEVMSQLPSFLDEDPEAIGLELPGE